MARRNIDRTWRRIENRPETEQVFVDGDTSEVIFRAIVDDVTDDFKRAVDELPTVDIQKVQYVGIGVEVTLR